MISKDEYKSRRQELIDILDHGIIIIPGYPYKNMSNDVEYEFRQHTDLLYFTGFPEPNTTAIIENSPEKQKFTLFVPERDKEFEIWNGRRYGTDGAINEFDADEAYNNEELPTKLPEILVNYEKVYHVMNQNEELDQLVLSSMQKAVSNREKKGRGPFQLINPIYEFHALRNIKSTAEIELLRKTAEISAEAMSLAMKVTKPGMKERQIEALIEYHYAKNGCDREAYPSIVGSGINATILHYIENNAELHDGELLLIDAGAEYEGYAADITRTWPINGAFTEPQRDIYQLVLDTQKKCINEVKPGVKLWDLQDMAVDLLTQGLLDLGLLEGEKEKIIEEKTYRRFFMHGLSHWLGMDVHDCGKIDRKEELLKPGQYFTVEPGIYIPDEEDIPEKYRGIGVRIEDDILVTDSGYENLTDGVVKEIHEIEAIIGSIELP